MGGDLLEDGIAALRERVEGWVVASEALGGGAEEGETGGELESVDVAADQVFERETAG